MEDGGWHLRFVSPQRVRDGFREFLTEFRAFDLPDLARIRHKTTFNQNCRAVLSAQNRVEPRMTDAAIFQARRAQHGAVDANGELEVLRVISVVGKNLRPDVRPAARDGGRHPGRRQTVGFETGRFFVRRPELKCRLMNKSA